ncbi:MAG: TatD family hydrolase, partial [Candidatus Methylacidiphilales bacterium]
MIDTHAHLDFPDFDADREAMLARAAQAGVTEIISIGTRLDSSANAVDLAARYTGEATADIGTAMPAVWATVGVHPGEADTVPSTASGDSADWIDELRRLASHPRVVAIGEIGLDYHHLPSEKMPQGLDGGASSDAEEADRAYKAQQEQVFRRQLDLAVELGLNVVIHQRDSWDDTLAILSDYRGRVRGVFHCFGGTEEQAQALFQQGHLVSFTGIVTFKNAKQVQASVLAVPAWSFMLETDCPYLAPVPHRGKRCEPAHTARTAEYIAQARGISVEELS